MVLVIADVFDPLARAVAVAPHFVGFLLLLSREILGVKNSVIGERHHDFSRCSQHTFATNKQDFSPADRPVAGAELVNITPSGEGNALQVRQRDAVVATLARGRIPMSSDRDDAPVGEILHDVARAGKRLLRVAPCGEEGELCDLICDVHGVPVNLG